MSSLALGTPSQQANSWETEKGDAEAKITSTSPVYSEIVLGQEVELKEAWS